MYSISDRSVRKYRYNLRQHTPFHIELKTKDGIVDIRVDGDGNATMLNKDTCQYDLALGEGSYVVDSIESGAPIPALKPFWNVQAEASEEMPLPGYQVRENAEEAEESARQEAKAEIEPAVILEPEVKPSPRGERSRKGEKVGEDEPVRAPVARERVASSAPLLVAAYKSGARKFRKGWDSLHERNDGVLVWELAIRKQVDNHWQTIDTVTVALFTPTGIEIPTDTRQYGAVMARRVLVVPNYSGQG